MERGESVKQGGDGAPVIIPTVSRPRISPVTSSTAFRTASTLARAVRAWTSADAPAVVRVGVRPDLLVSVAPRSCSSCRICALTPDWLMCSRSAARVKFASSASPGQSNGGPRRDPRAVGESAGVLATLRTGATVADPDQRRYRTHLHRAERWRGRPRAGGAQATGRHLASSARPARVRATSPVTRTQLATRSRTRADRQPSTGIRVR